MMIEPNDATRQFIRDHQQDDVRRLALQGCRDQAVDLPFALQQIEGRQKAKEKLPEFYACDEILYPATLSMEQCSSSVTAQYKASLIGGGTLADLSGGFGVDTFAFAQRFGRCLHVEPQGELSALARHNAAALGHRNIDFQHATLEEAFPTLPDTDYLFLDPSRRDSHGGRVVTLEECTPNLLQHKDILLQKARRGVLVKLSPMIDLKRTLMQLPETRAIHVVALHNECKEVLFLLQPGASPEALTITAVNLRDGREVRFTFMPAEELAAAPMLTDTVGAYLYEPNAALMKAGAFKTVAVRHALRKLHPHSHLYTSDEKLADFPGRVFRVEEVVPFNKRCGKAFAGTKANVAVRNFPLTAEQLKKELKLKDGGDVYLFGTTLSGEKKVLIKTRKG